MAAYLKKEKMAGQTIFTKEGYGGSSLLLRNKGNLELWGTLFEDFNLDGRQDLVVAENYIDFPPQKLFRLPCSFLIQRPDGTFSAVEDQAGDLLS